MMKKLNISITTLLTAVAMLFAANVTNAQLVGVPNADPFAFFSTTAFGRQLAHEQVPGSFGSFAPSAQWIGIGQPTLGGLPLPIYGMRLQWNGNLGTFSLEDNGQLEIQWGGDGSTSDLDFNFVFNPFAGAAGERNVMRMTDGGRVGINTTSPIGRLDTRVNSTDNETYAVNVRNNRSTGSIYGVYSRANNDANSSKYGVLGIGSGGQTNGYGVYGIGKIEEGNSYGVFGEAIICEGFGYGVYGTTEACGSATTFAGYFDGDVVITGSLSVTSDRRLKQNIENETNALDRIMQLRPTTYEFNQEKYSFMNLDEGLNHGFIAQELEEVFPEMVTKAAQPLTPSVEVPEGEEVTIDENGAEVFEYKSVNYTALIPVLTKAIQEQQVQLEAEKTRNDELQSELEAIKAQLALLGANSGKGASSVNDLESNVLFQNVPNPFNENTEIRYTTVRTAGEVSMNLYDLQGREIARYTGLTPGEGAVNISGSTLEAGMYIYSLIVDGQEVATKRMILTKN